MKLDYLPACITCGQNEIDGVALGDTVTVTRYVPARHGSGWDSKGSVTGKLVTVVRQNVTSRGCSFTWADVKIDNR